MNQLDIPRTIDPAKTFEALVNWFHDELVIHRGAPGFLVGLSGTDSVVAFLAASKAFERAKMPNRVMGIHFAPSEDFIYDHPEAEIHLWFSQQVVPWLREQAPETEIAVDTSIDWRQDGLRWGLLADFSVVDNQKSRIMRLPEDQYWIVGTRNRSEDTLLTYSNASMLASLQPLIHLWKSEILQISEHLRVPKVAITKSCETDCICGRMRLPAQHIREVDTLLMYRRGELSGKYVEDNIQVDLRRLLSKFIETQIGKGSFKESIPYTPDANAMCYVDPLVVSFENGTINIKEFNHRKHVYIAWYYLNSMPFEKAFERYVHYLINTLASAGQNHRFNRELTRAYFTRLDEAMKRHPHVNFDELVVQAPSVLDKISA